MQPAEFFTDEHEQRPEKHLYDFKTIREMYRANPHMFHREKALPHSDSTSHASYDTLGNMYMIP